MVNVALPRWSPDGKTIAFMGDYANAPLRIYTTQAAGGSLHEASIGTDNQGAPTWSPDGKSLVYGRVMCQEEKSCAIMEINLHTGEQTMVPGSEGLGTARWSPNGRFVAALRPDRQEVVLLDRKTGKWRRIADGVNGDDLAWSSDSQTLYASRPYGDRPQVVRIGLADGKIEPAVDLSDFSKLSGRIDTWFAVTPDDSILFLHIISGNEVVALNYTLK
jgi:Tol biopolymer transport system component